jgi:hypothetical protein
LENLRQREFKYSIQHTYNLLPWVVDPRNLERLTPIVKWMSEIHKLIVGPMTADIKDLMETYSFLNEAELFSSEMEFRVSDQSISKRIIGDNALSNEDQQLKCNKRLAEIIKKYRELMFGYN